MPEMPRAVDRVIKAIASNEAILIYGDNDVDGMTATALLTEFLHFWELQSIFSSPAGYTPPKYHR